MNTDRKLQKMFVWSIMQLWKKQEEDFRWKRTIMTQTEWLFTWLLWWLWIAWILDYFWIVHDWFVIMSIMLVLDWIFWVASAYVLWEKVESRTMRLWLVKKCTRWILPFIIAWALKRTWLPVERLITCIIWIIVFSEVYSVIWHIYSINTKEKLPEIDAFKMLLWKLANFFKKLIDNNLSEIEKKCSSDWDEKTEFEK